MGFLVCCSVFLCVSGVDVHEVSVRVILVGMVVAGLQALVWSGFCAAVAYVIGRGCHVAVRICYTYKSLDSVVFERRGDVPSGSLSCMLFRVFPLPLVCVLSRTRVYIFMGDTGNTFHNVIFE